MIHLFRAWIALLFAGLLVIVLLVAELPVSELLHQRSELASTSHELAVIEAQDHGLTQTIKALSNNAAIAAIAHSDYGLTLPGQISYVVLPGATGIPGGVDTLAQKPIPATDVVPADATSLVAASVHGVPTTAHSGIWSRVAERLFFWRWAF